MNSKTLYSLPDAKLVGICTASTNKMHTIYMYIIIHVHIIYTYVRRFVANRDYIYFEICLP